MFFNYRTGGEFMPPAWCRKRMCSHIGRTASAAALVTGGSGGFLPPLSCIINPQTNIVNTYLKIYFGNKHFSRLYPVLLRPNAKLCSDAPALGSFCPARFVRGIIQ